MPGFHRAVGFPKTNPANFIPAASGFQTFSPGLSANPTISLVTSGIGNIVVIAVTTFAAEAVNSVTGSSITGTKILVPNFTDAFSANDWMGLVSVTGMGTNTVTIALAGSPSSSIHVAAREFIVAGAASQDGSSSTSALTGATITLPSLTPAAPKEMYISLMRGANAGSFGPPAAPGGFTYDNTNNILGFIWNPDCGTGAQAPQAVLTPSSQTWQTGAALVAA